MDRHGPIYRVMIVDDEAILRTGMLHLCRWQDFGIEIVAQAANGQEALQQIELVQPHVVLTDIVMPVMDGVELTKKLRVQYPDIKIVVLSSYSEYDYVREVFKYGVTDYLLKPKVSASELVALIQTLCSSIELNRELPQSYQPLDPSLLLGRWLSSEESDHQEEFPIELAKQYSLDRFILIKASTTLVLSRTKWNQGQMEKIILELAAEQLSAWRYNCVFLKNEILLLLHYEQAGFKQVASALHEFATNAKLSLTYLSFVRSVPFQAFDEIKRNHERLSPFLGKMIYFIDQSLVAETEIDRVVDQVSFDQSLFTAALRSFEVEEARAQLKAFFSELTSTRATDEYSLKRLSQNLIYTALSVLEQMKQPVSELTRSRLKLFKRIDLAFDVQELEEILLHFLDELKLTLPFTDKQQSILLQQIYTYVDDNYASDISLSEMAGQLHMNYSYLSTYFKQRTHENLTSYINRVRINKAKELLLRQHLTVSEISRLTGYSDHNYFSKVFKKRTGMTPVEYRNHTSSGDR
ncbi:response regulator transcription factor [Paenibacillus herberti]|uniref:DNA-binding response regulator n=1 Tax=Paenibacillus herberti TaxID=1619309 RepID=A0A229NWA1_9BACL|nr:response regulator transcription factor [Paenibacillus herberti]OXM13919.1 hypothetical protein CGZ75_12970 [Paenibacillus herberti]